MAVNNPTTSDWVRFQQDHPDLFLSTTSEKERKNAVLKQTQELANLNIPIQQKTTEPEPVDLPVEEEEEKSIYDNPTIKKYLNKNTLVKEEDSRWSEDLQSDMLRNKSIYDDPVIQKYLTPQATKNNLDTSLDSYSDKEYDLYDLDEDQNYQKVAERFLRSIGSNENIYENLRDAKYSIGDAVSLALRSGNWDQQTKDDYKYLKTTFDNADLGGTGHILQATKDIAIDLVFDLPNLLAVPFIASTGGLGGVALAGAAKFGATQAFRQSAKKLSQDYAKNKLMRTASIGMTEGAYDAGVIGVSNQLSDMQTGIRENFSAPQAVGMTFGGAALGGGAAYGLVKAANAMARRNLNKYVEESGIDAERVKDATAENVKLWRKELKLVDNVLGQITGKATTPYKTLGEESQMMRQFLLNIRHDAMRRVTDKGLDDVAQVNFGGAANARGADYSLRMQKAMKNLEGKFGKVDPQDNSDILYLLTRKNFELSDYVNLVKRGRKGENDVYSITGEILRPVDGEDTGVTRAIPDNVLKAAKGIEDTFAKIYGDGFDLTKIGGLQDGTTFNLFDNVTEKVAKYFPRHWKIRAVEENTEELEGMLVASRHTDMRLERMTDEGIEELNLSDGVTRYVLDFDADGKVIPESMSRVDNKAKKFIKVTEDTIDQKVFGGVLDPTTNKPFLEKYNGFEDMALESIKKKYKLQGIKTKKELLKFDSTIADEFDLTARKFKAKVIVQNMLNKNSPKYRHLRNADEGSLGGTSFLQERAFDDLPDARLIEAGFIDSDIQKVSMDYALSMGKTIERAQYFGRSEREFGDNYIIPIIDELNEAGVKFDESNLVDSLTKLYKVTSGVQVNKTPGPRIAQQFIRGAGDVIKVSQQLAHLPFATLSSITEPLIALSRADVPDANAFATEFARAGGKQIKKNLIKVFDRMQNLTGKKTKLFKELDDEDFYDAYHAGVATENAIMDKIEGMYGEGLDSNVAKKISNAFFNINLLTPWTQAVQMGAYRFGQQKVIRILGELDEGTNFYGVTLDAKARQRRLNQLHEIGIDSSSAVREYKAYKDSNGDFDEHGFRESEFFDKTISPSTAMFSREIILNPSAAEGSKPLWMNSYGAQIFVQFAGYPTAFNNTVIKGMARNIIRDPTGNIPKIMAVTTMMTGAAAITNAIRSEGRSVFDAESNEEIIGDAVRRWGGYGPYEYIYRYIEGSANNQGVAALLKAPAGPIVADIVDMIIYRQGLPEVLLQNMPGWGALDRDTRRELRKFAKSFGKEFNYNRVKGGSLQGFAEGGKVTASTQQNEIYQFLIRDEDEYTYESSSAISLYKKEDLPDLDIKDTFYINLKGFTVKDKYDAYRKSDTIGVPVYKAKGKGNIAGKIKFHKLLELDIKSPTIEAVQQSINKNKDKIIYTDTVIAKEIIKETDYQITLREDVLRDDPNKTKDIIQRIKRSKSFLVRNEILKLGYDAIKTKEGYTLLRENQFLPMQILNRKENNKLVSGLRKRNAAGGEQVFDINTNVQRTIIKAPTKPEGSRFKRWVTKKADEFNAKPIEQPEVKEETKAPVPDPNINYRGVGIEGGGYSTTQIEDKKQPPPLKADQEQTLYPSQTLDKPPLNDPSNFRDDGSKKSQTGYWGRLTNQITGKIHTELYIGGGDEERYPSVTPFLEQKHIDNIVSNDYEGKAYLFQETPIGVDTLERARDWKHYRKVRGMDPFLQEGEQPPKLFDSSTHIPYVPINETNGVTFNDRKISDKEYIIRLAYAEAKGEGTEGMALVINSFFNRMGLVKGKHKRHTQFNATENSVIGFIRGEGQYQPHGSGELYKELSNEQLQEASSAYDLALSPDRLKKTLVQQGITEDNVKYLLGATGFRSPKATADPSQDVNIVKYKGHIFNTAGNDLIRLPYDPN